MTSTVYYQTMMGPSQSSNQQTNQQLPMYYHPQQQSHPMIQQPHIQQLHHMVPTQPRELPPPAKEMHKPKGRMSAYTFFVQKCRDEHRKAYPNENANFSEFSKKCAEKWKTMTESEKAKFAAQAEIDKQRFEREMAVYQPGEKRTKKRKKDPLAPKRPLSAFFHYCKEERPKLKALNPSLSVGDIAKELGDRWNHTAPDGKQSYEEAAQRDKERYEKEMTEFKLANKKASKSNGSSQALPTPSTQPIQAQVVQQASAHHSEQMRIHHDQSQQQQYSSSSYQLPSFTPMQSFQPQTYTQLNNFQDNSSHYPHYNGYSLQMPHNNMPMQTYSTLQPATHVQHQTYQMLTSVNVTNRRRDDDEGEENAMENDDEDDDQSDGDE